MPTPIYRALLEEANAQLDESRFHLTQAAEVAHDPLEAACLEDIIGAVAVLLRDLAERQREPAAVRSLG